MQHAVRRNLHRGFFKRLRIITGFALVSLTAAGSISAATFEWAASVDGRFEQGSSWSPFGVPDSDDIAQFSVSSGPSYEVLIGSNPTIDKLIVDGGTPVLTGTSGQRTLTVTDDGGVTDEDILVIGGGRLDILSQVDVVAGDGILSVGNDGDGLLTVESATASLTVDGTSRSHFVGGRGALGQLVVSDNATASFGFHAGSEGTLGVGVSSFNATQGFVNVLGGGTLNTGNLDIATFNTDATGFVSVQDAGTTVNVLADTRVGSDSGGVGTLQISSSAAFNTVGLDVEERGVVEVTGGATGGRLNAAGPVNIAGGMLSVGDSGVFNLEAGQTLTASIDAQVEFVGSYNLDVGTTFDINSGSDLSATQINIGATGGDGTLVVDGSGSTVTAATGLSVWGLGGDSADVTFRNQAVGDFGELRLADSSGFSTVGNLSVETGADVTTDGLAIATQNSGATGTVTINGIGSTLTQNGESSLTLGNASGSGTAMIVVRDLGTFNTGTGTTTINATGTLSLDAGDFIAGGEVIVDGGRVFNGSFSFFDISVGGVTVRGGGVVSGAFLSSSQPILIEGSGTIVSGGTLGVVGPVTIRDNAAASASTTISGGMLTVSEGATLDTETLFNLGDSSTATMTITSGGVVTSDAADLALGTQSSGQATVTISGADSAWIVANGIALGGLASTVEGDAQINVDNGGLLNVGGEILIQATSEIAIDGGQVVAGEIDNTRGGTFDFNSGTLSVETFEGDLDNQGGKLAPGTSAGSTTVLGDYTQQTDATIEIEIGGTAAVTEHDFVNVSGSVVLDGLLDLSLIDGFLPDASDTFTVLAAGTLTGFFDNATPGARLDTSDGLGSFLVDIDSALDQIVLRDFVPTFTADFDNDGDVDAEDLSQWRTHYGLTGSDANGDGVSNGSDFLIWQRQFGGGVTTLQSTHTVPEPSIIVLSLTLLAAVLLWRSAYP